MRPDKIVELVLIAADLLPYDFIICVSARRYIRLYYKVQSPGR